MAIVHRLDEYNPLHEVFITMLRMRNRTSPNKTEEKVLAAKTLGWREGAATVLAACGSQARQRAFQEAGATEEWFPGVDEWVVLQWLRQVLDRWEDGEWKDLPDEKFYSDMTREFNEIIFNSAIQADLTSLRKKAVLAGLVEPNESDREWLVKEQETFTAMATPYQEALKKIGDRQ